MSLAELLREELKNQFDPGTVVRFNWNASEPDDTCVYTFAALYVHNLWWLTGTRNTFGQGRGGMSTTAFLEILRRDDVSDIEVPTGWDSVK